MALEKLEMHDIQDKTRLLDEMNETREGVNKLFEVVKFLDRKVSKLMRTPEAKGRGTSKPNKPTPPKDAAGPTK